MIDFSSGYTKEEIQRQMLAQVDNDLDKRQGSLIQTAVAPVAWYLEGAFLSIAKLQNNTSPTLAVGDSLDLLVALRGITRKAATPAVRQGTFDAPIPAGSTFKTINGADSVSFASGDLISQDSGIYIYALTCEVAGTIGNSYTGDILPITAIPGLTSASIGEIITVGTDAESDDSLRARYFETFTDTPYGGNIAEYRKAILAINGVGAVQVYPAYNGGGTVLCSILDSDYNPAESALIDVVQAVICPQNDGESNPSPNGYGIAPIGAAVTITTGTALPLNIEFTVQFTSGIENGLSLYREDIEEAVAAYIKEVREGWGTALRTHSISYPVTIYAARLIYMILTVPQVVNVTGLTINGVSGDNILTETAALQQVPEVGSVIIHDV
jgi:uncharacterized phage protein gp47/JayE